MSVASITVLMSCLIVMGSFALLVLNINYNMEDLGDLNVISAFVETKTDYAEGEGALLAGDLKSSGGAEFLGWSLDPNADTPTYAAGQTYTVNSADARGNTVTLYAIWNVKPSTANYSIVYNMSSVGIDGDIPVDENKYNHGDQVTLAAAPVPNYSSNSFLGWSITPGATEASADIMSPGSFYTLNSGNAVCGTITLYAVWSNMPVISSYNIIYNANRTELEGVLPTQDKVILDDIGVKIANLDNDNIKHINLVTKEQALEEERERYADYPGLIDSALAEGNFYPDNFIITYYDNDKVETLKYQLDDLNIFYKITDRSELATRIDYLKSGVIIVFSWFLALLFIVSIFIIMNTVKLAVFTRKQEISIMRYVGATNWFITLPFMLEGVLIGLISGGLAYLIEWYIYLYLQKMVISDTIQMIHIVSFNNLSMWLSVGFIATGILTGVIGSLISMRRYLKA
jgi:Cell division protein